MTTLIVLLLVLLVVLWCGADRNHQLALMSWSWVYLAGCYWWSILGYPTNPDGSFNYQQYAAVLSTMSACQILIYATLPKLSPYIIAAAGCEVSLICLYLVLASGSVPAWSIRAQTVDLLNIAALAALTGGWWNGRFDRGRRAYPAIRMGGGYRAAVDWGVPAAGKEAQT